MWRETLCDFFAVQIKSLAELGWFLSLGTAAQLFAVVVVVVKLLMAPMPGAATQLIATGAPAASVVAVMNLIFACAPFERLSYIIMLGVLPASGLRVSNTVHAMKVTV